MLIDIRGFDWDAANMGKLGKHNVSQEEAEEVFYLSPLIDEGAYEKAGEKRYRCLGITSAQRHLAAFFTIRRHRIRCISVRAMRRTERSLYEEARHP